MLDPHYLRENPNDVARHLKKRNFQFDVENFIQLEEKRKILQTATQALQNERNQRSKAIGLLKAQGEDIDQLRSEVNVLGQQLEEKKNELDALLAEIEAISLNLPNIPHSSVPEGFSEEDNVEIRRWGDKPVFNFNPKSHDELGEKLGQLDFEASAKLTGSRFVVMKNELAQLHRALIQFMLDVHTIEHHYQEIYVPYMVNADSLFGTGQLPKFEQDLFKIEGEPAYYLIPTAEIPVTNTVRDTILNVEQLPIRYTCHSPCFRKEAGSYGRDTKGMFRQHQFEKVELVCITTPDSSYEILEQLTQHAEAILQKLNLHYRVVNLCTGDLGRGSAKTYDLEVWLPSQNTFREISSCSNFESYQSRRMQARFRDAETQSTKLVHTLNGSGLAIGRTLLAIIENYQDELGRVHIPEVLQTYMKGKKVIALS